MSTKSHSIQKTQDRTLLSFQIRLTAAECFLNVDLNTETKDQAEIKQL